MVQFYLDHNVAAGVAGELSNLGHQAINARQLGLAGATDATQLLTAVQRGAVLVTNNRDFLALQAAWREWATAWRVTPVPVHHGILLIKQGQMGGAVPAAQYIHAHVVRGPVLPNTLWQWTVSGTWTAP